LTVFAPLPKPRSDRIPSFHPLSPKVPTSSFNVAPPDVSTPDLSPIQPRPDSPRVQRPQTERPSSTQKLSGWLAAQRKRLSTLSHRGDGQDGMNAQLWNQNRAERGQSLREDSSTKDSDVFEKVYGYPDPYLGADQAQPPPIGKPKPEPPKFGRGSTWSMTSRYSDLDLSPPRMLDKKSLQAESPVFGLNGIVRPSTGQSKMDSPQDSVTITGPDRSSNISDLFRKQEELDNSIAALKLLEGPADLPSSPSSSKQSGEPSTARSDFSLSNFPNPPWVDSADSDSDDPNEPRLNPGPARTPQSSALRFNPPSVSVENVPFDLIPPRIRASVMEHNRALSLPISEFAESDLIMSARTPRFDSQGTQYDVTSFIGSTFLRLVGFPVCSRFDRSDRCPSGQPSSTWTQERLFRVIE
jgi:hypothetical protein